MKNKIFYIITILLVVAPYKYLNQDYTNGLLAFMLVLFAVLNLKNFKIEKKYTIALLILNIAAFLSLFLTKFSLDSLQGFSVYFGTIICYFIFSSFKDIENKILKIVSYTIGLMSIFYIVLEGAIKQGSVLNGRMDGNIGYANTYALILLIGLYINTIRKKDPMKDLLDITFISGILFTGSRNTLLYLGIFIILEIIKVKKDSSEFNLLIVFNAITSIGIYLVVDKLGLGIVLVLPIIIIFYFYIIKEKIIKIINRVVIVAIPIIAIELIFIQSSLVSRLYSMSLTSTELQQRFIYMKDAWNYILKNPLGAGINTYIYTEGRFQTAPYDVRYIHNSILQALYDMGFLGMCAFILVFIIGFIIIYKSNNPNRIYYLFLYNTIYLHSLLDFDFAYMVIFSIVTMIIAFCSEDDYEIKIRPFVIWIPITIFSAYIALLTICVYVGEQANESGNFKTGISMGKIIDKITIADNVGKIIKFNSYINRYSLTGEKESLKEGINILEEGLDSDNRLNYLYRNLAVIYENSNELEKAFKCYDKYLELRKFDYETFKHYYQLLINEKNKNNKYENRALEVLVKYNKLKDGMDDNTEKYFFKLPNIDE